MLTHEDLQGIDIHQASVLDRYYSKKYSADVGGVDGNDHVISQHHNGLCVVMIAPNHPMCSKTVQTVDFKVTDKCDRSDISLSGKKKRGAQFMNDKSKLCLVSCTDGSTYSLYSCIRGRLIEVNEHLKTNPQLLTTHCDSDGYIAIIQPKKEEQKNAIKLLMTEEEYISHLIKRDNSVEQNRDEVTGNEQELNETDSNKHKLEEVDVSESKRLCQS